MCFLCVFFFGPKRCSQSQNAQSLRQWCNGATAERAMLTVGVFSISRGSGVAMAQQKPRHESSTSPHGTFARWKILWMHVSHLGMGKGYRP